MDVTCTGEVQHRKSSATAFYPAPQSHPTQNLCVYLVKVAVLPASVLANQRPSWGRSLSRQHRVPLIYAATAISTLSCRFLSLGRDSRDARGSAVYPSFKLQHTLTWIPCVFFLKKQTCKYECWNGTVIARVTGLHGFYTCCAHWEDTGRVCYRLFPCSGLL